VSELTIADRIWGTFGLRRESALWRRVTDLRLAMSPHVGYERWRSCALGAVDSVPP
jgi:hypothetical protein